MALGFSVNVQFSLRCFINYITLLIFSDKSFTNDRIKSFWKVLNSIKGFWIMKGFGNFTVLMLISAVVKITNIWAPDILRVKKNRQELKWKECPIYPRAWGCSKLQNAARVVPLDAWKISFLKRLTLTEFLLFFVCFF